MKKALIGIRSAILVFMTHKIALPVLKIMRKPIQFPFDMYQLMFFPSGSLGKDLYFFLQKRNLPLLKHYARHDLKHVLLNYDTTDEGEACLQCFMLGNGRVSFPVLATALYALFTMPEYWQKMKSAFILGKRSTAIHGWMWNEILNEQTVLLRDKIFLKK